MFINDCIEIIFLLFPSFPALSVIAFVRKIHVYEDGEQDAVMSLKIRF